MRIGMVTACYKPVINGVTRMVSLYKEHLEAAGHEVTIFTLGEPDPDDEPGVVRSPGLMLGDYGYYISMRYSNKAQALLQEMDIIHCHHLFMSVEMAHRYGRSPIVYTNHTRYDLYTGSFTSLPQPAADAIMRQVWPEFTDYADVVITPSASVRDVMLEFGVRRPIEVIENGVDLKPFHFPIAPLTKTDLGVPETAVLVTYVGRLSPEKDVDILLEQFAIAKDVVPNLHLMIIGKGPSQAELQNITKELGIAQSVLFTGAVAYENVGNYLAAADLFATASTTEVHPLTVIEAMAAGLPVVAVSSPGIVDTVESGHSGLLTTKPVGGLAAALVGLASNPERRQQMAQAARNDSERFGIHNTIQRTIDLYERLHQERPDLRRKKMHGRRIFDSERLQPVVGQLGKLLRPEEKESASRRWFLPSSTTQSGQQPHDN
ncbi:MAG: glycosyltransferase [Ardenticatenaceae bacterium]|nr:glycosyltransferase [Anaerolineales bacterium]MCB8940255.1 glycosyltransferase [Ardenticatenaceae bacterium]MCB8973270.1 glycosyltransferase [Ardenticatenaceae bacterium]